MTEEIEKEIEELRREVSYCIRHKSNPKHAVNRIAYLREFLKEQKELK